MGNTIISPSEQVIHFAAQCPVCKKYYDIAVDLSKKLAANDGRIVCCADKRCQHPVLNWISPYAVRDVTQVKQTPQGKVRLSRP